MTIPEVKNLTNKNMRELKKLTITKVSESNNLDMLGLTLYDGQSCSVKLGKRLFYKSYIFDPQKKITMVETIVNQYEYEILRINFFSGEERLA